MASAEDDSSDTASVKSDLNPEKDARRFKCCARKVCRAYFCINCDEIYHGSCAKRKNIKFLSRSRVLCCDLPPKSLTTNSRVEKEESIRIKCENDKLKNEIVLLNKLISEMSDKNSILKENNLLLAQKIQNLEKDKKGKQDDGSHKKAKIDTKLPSYSQAAKSGIDSSNAPITSTVGQSSQAHAEKRSDQRQLNLNSHSRNLTNSNPQQVIIPAEFVKNAINNAVAKTNVDSEGFSTVSYRRGTSRNRTLRGSSLVNFDQDFIPAKEARMWFYVGKAAQSVNNEIIGDYISKKLSAPKESIVIEQLKTVGKTNSFKVGVELKYYETMNSSTFWPAGIHFRRFNFARRSIQQKENGTTFSTEEENFQLEDNNVAMESENLGVIIH